MGLFICEHTWEVVKKIDKDGKYTEILRCKICGRLKKEVVRV